MAERTPGVLELAAVQGARMELNQGGVVENGITNRAVNIAGRISKLRSVDAGVAQTAKDGLEQLFKGFGVTSYEALSQFLAGDREGVTPARAKELERLSYDVIDGVVIGTMWGLNVDEEMIMAVKTKDAGKIDQLYGLDQLKGLGEVVVASAVTDIEIANRLVKLQRLLDKGVGTVEHQFTKAFNDIERLYDEGEVDEVQAEMVMAYLTEMIAAAVPAKDVAKSAEAASGDLTKLVDAVVKGNEAQAELAQRQLDLQKLVETTSLNELLAAMLNITAPRERSPQGWEYHVPDFMNGMSLKEWRKALTFCERYFGAVYNKRNDNEPNGGYNNNPDEVNKKILNMVGLEEKDFAFFYRHNDFNLRGVMHAVMTDLMTPKKIIDQVYTQDDDGREIKKSVERTIFVFKEISKPTEKNPEGSDYAPRAALFRDSEEAYKDSMVKILVEKGIVPNEKVGMMALALGMNIMEIGGVFSLADTKRRISWESDAVRLIQRPETKFSAKLGDEMWGGAWAEYFEITIGRDKRQVLAEATRLGLLPKLLAGSFLNQEVGVVGSKDKMDLGVAIYNNAEISFKEVATVDGLGKSIADEDGNPISGNTENDLFFGWRKDQIKAGADVWANISNANPLEFKDISQPDLQARKWRKSLYNAVVAMRGENNKGSLLPTSLIAGAIGGSVGLWPFAGPYLRLTGTAEANVKWFSAAVEIVRSLGVGEKEQSELLEFFGVDRRYFVDYNDRVSYYNEALNANTNPKRRQKIWGEVLRKPRKNR